MSRVDVFVPCYNYGRFLRECVQSVLTQEGVDVRVLILDDCSTDNSEEVGRQLASEDSRVEYRRHEVNRGHIATYNEGIDWASGDYVQLLSADDLLTQGALGRAAKLMDANPDVAMTYGEIIRTETPDYSAVPAPVMYDSEIIPGPEFIERCCRVSSNLVEAATAVVRTRVHKAIGGYRKELPHAGDLEMWLRCASMGAIGHVKAPQGFYRRHGSNMSTGFVQRRDHDQVRAAFEYFFREFGQSVPDRERLASQLREALSAQAFYLANDAFDTGNRRACSELLDEAESLWLGIRRTPGWKRLKLKRLVGRRLCSVLRTFKTGRRHATAAA